MNGHGYVEQARRSEREKVSLSFVSATAWGWPTASERSVQAERALADTVSVSRGWSPTCRELDIAVTTHSPAAFGASGA
jgi:hypothetical protein